MSRKKRGRGVLEELEEELIHRLHPETKKSIWALIFGALGILLTLAGFEKAGPVGHILHGLFGTLLGVGYFILPITLFLAAGVFLSSERRRILGVTTGGALLLVLSLLALIELVLPGRGGYLGMFLASLRYPFGDPSAIVLNIIIALIGFLMLLNLPLKIRWPGGAEDENAEEVPMLIEAHDAKAMPTATDKAAEEIEIDERTFSPKPGGKMLRTKFKDYVPPPLSLLESSNEKPTTGDLRGNANIIKRTLESFGISVEMGEISIGPKVTRYTLKPAEGVKLSRITALGQDLSLALAAHPIRIEAPIPGKSLVGVEVPNKTAALVRLGNLMAFPEFAASGPLGIALGRDVTGEPIFANIEKMPHLLVAGSTGSGKSVSIHSIIISLLYKNSPQTLRMVLVDPKRVELSLYEGLPHLVSPVIMENKKAVAVFRWAISEMERRYDLLQKGGSRDIKSYNAKNADEPLPYLLIVVDELADLMASYGREVEGSIIRLAQMARATGLHLVLSTQRPSVEVITGLIKANITSRMAFQVASQIDSRTILDTAGAEKLLGGGDLLFISSELSKPKRIQGAFLPEAEINAVANFIREHNERAEVESDAQTLTASPQPAGGQIDQYLDDSSDELYDEAVTTVRVAGKASASLLQRRLKVGYARAARLLDLMEERGVIGPGDGAKPREVFMDEGEPVV